MSLRYGLVVLAAPTRLGNRRAYQFAQALLDEGHSIGRVFFYDDGASTGLSAVVTPQDEHNSVDQWADFGKRHNIELVVCIASALKRGVLDETEAKRYDKNQATLHPGFQIGGLGLLVDAAAHCDRLITFGP